MNTNITSKRIEEMFSASEKVSLDILINGRLKHIEQYTGEYYATERKELQDILSKLSDLTDYSVIE